MRFPFALRRTLEAREAELKAAQEALEKLQAESRTLREQTRSIHSVAQQIQNNNIMAARLLGILAQRQTVRVHVHDLRGKPPTIMFVTEENARKPTVRVEASYPDAFGEPPPPENSVKAVDPKIALPDAPAEPPSLDPVEATNAPAGAPPAL